MSFIKSYLKRLIDNSYTLLCIVQIYIVVGGRFCSWRARLWLQQIHLVESTQIHMKQTLLFVRHGQTTWNVEHRLPGQLPGVALSDIGRQQAARLAESLTILPLSAIISSPLERACDTAEIIAKGRGLDVQFEPDLMDTDVGRWSGQVIEELTKNDPAWKEYVRDPTVAPEGIETFPQVQQRVVAAVERWRAREGIGAYPVFVAHADVVKLLIAHYTGLEAKRAGSISIDNASVSLVEIDDEHKDQRVVSIGWSPHPTWLKPPEEKKSQEPTHEVGEQKT
ncbi:MAG TPA: histidine phosphatase family protein [Ktedonobacteraceae bacterium]|nr:histidine phosphatase family protein [Ktedonobacteraceae bacterium]